MSYRILGFGGSLRKRSYSSALLVEAGKLMPDDHQLKIFDISGIPVLNADHLEKLPASVVEFKNAIKESDGILICTPEYNYSIPGFLKNAIDYASVPPSTNYFPGKPVAFMSSSIGHFGGSRAQYHLRQVAVYLDMHPVNKPEVFVSNVSSRFDENMQLKDEDVKVKIRNLLTALISMIDRFKN